MIGLDQLICEITNSQLSPHANMMADKFNKHLATIASKFNTTSTTVPKCSKLRNFISCSKPENASFKLLNMNNCEKCQPQKQQDVMASVVNYSN